MRNFPVNLGIIVGSHLNDAMYEMSFNPELAAKRLKFIKALTFFNENLKESVTEAYCDWLWNQLEIGEWGSEYKEGIEYKNKK